MPPSSIIPAEGSSVRVVGMAGDRLIHFFWVWRGRWPARWRLKVLVAEPGALQLITPSWSTLSSAQLPLVALYNGIMVAFLALGVVLVAVRPERGYFIFYSGLFIGLAIVVVLVFAPRLNRRAFQYVKQNPKKSVELKVLEVRPTWASRTTKLLAAAEGQVFMLTVRDPRRELGTALRLAGQGHQQ